MVKHYDKKFEEDALQYRKDHPDLTVAAVCRYLGISTTTFYNWLKRAKQNDAEDDHISPENYASEETKEIALLKRKIKNKNDTLHVNGIVSCIQNAKRNRLLSNPIVIPNERKSQHVSKDYFKNLTSVRKAVFEYIEVFCNPKRIHSRLDYQTPR